MQNTWNGKEKEKWLIRLLRPMFPELPNNPLKNHEENHFLSTTIKNWLRSVNELGYQFPFCQYLISKGFSICHNSKHNAFEQGKDIIAKDKNGTPHVFQLKGGNISISSWNNTIKSEIEKLIDLKIIHPSIDKTKKHHSYLVLNGDLEDTVRLEIDNLNEGKWKNNPLTVITIGQLELYFNEISRDFEPKKTSDYKLFLELYFSDGKEMLDEESFCNFIYDLLRIYDDSKMSDNERKRSISSAVVYSGFIISNFQKEKNYIATIHTLSLLLFSIFALTEKYNLKKKYWQQSVDLIYQEVNNQEYLLEEEIKDKGMISIIDSMWDGELGQYRRHLSTSYILTIKLSQLLSDHKNKLSLKNVDLIKEIKDTLKIWGEASIPPFIFNYLYASKFNIVEDKKISFLLELPLEVIIKSNGRSGPGSLFSPYYNILSVIKNNFGLLDEPTDEGFGGSSFYVNAICELMVRHGHRDYLQKRWREITYISNNVFIPEKIWMNFLWRCKRGGGSDGIVKSELPEQTKSWSVLKKESLIYNEKNIPKTFINMPYLLPLFLLIYPHRINADYIKYLDDKVEKLKI